MQRRELEGLKIIYCHVSWFENIEGIEMHSNLMYFHTLFFTERQLVLCFGKYSDRFRNMTSFFRDETMIAHNSILGPQRNLMKVCLHQMRESKEM